MTIRKAQLAVLILAGIAITNPSPAATLNVGANQTYKAPSAAAAVAKNGDRIEIEPGRYFDCAVWNADNLELPAGEFVAPVLRLPRAGRLADHLRAGFHAGRSWPGLRASARVGSHYPGRDRCNRTCGLSERGRLSLLLRAVRRLAPSEYCFCLLGHQDRQGYGRADSQPE
jgi:hypothetical protein